MIAICEFRIWYFVAETCFMFVVIWGFFANRKTRLNFIFMISVRVLGVIQRVHLSLVLKIKNIKCGVILMAKNIEFYCLLIDTFSLQ